ncbi:hypothetical protein G6F62_010205 [Rhizopus arrhizus]|uniref:Uncharacterized protein n=1 Tax=Rhizopus oryzae TaxID=64495 RepID=A0A9P7BPP8_RHIOR|nr:hypothetical protein G6F23_004937 [Rhizopus arrhizus]KAG0763060.1 hypothetical protein G6F24_006322 [Rhizopus arrhizus]KAG0787377.1 hypothetical protein G6F21_007943 [Rhizopus arrhizus]KAG0799594.1 hypothetical protein G6F22_003073 [Rhizopus arrhizus]KAG0808820.1 hypothetical protein G6F20_009265 [Rhizopus arrhizus]
MIQATVTGEEPSDAQYAHSERLGLDYAQEEEQSHLLNKETTSEDEDWSFMLDEGEDEGFSSEVSIIRYIGLGISIGLSFFAIKLLMTYLGHMNPMKRAAEKLYFNGTDYFAPTVVLISLDGFRPDYLERNITPHLDALANEGIRAEYMNPVFPPSTFPNHWTLVTGLYPETHGIVDNSFYDPDMGLFEHTNQSVISDHRWWKGEPIWLTSRINRQRTASIMWPGSSTHYNTPDYVIASNDSMRMKQRMQVTVDWLDLPYNKRPQMITVYMPQLEQEGHREGSDKIDDYIKEVDAAIGYLTNELSIRNLNSHVHTVIVSDHGTVSTSQDKLIYIDDILPSYLLKYVQNTSPSSMLRFQPELPKDVIQDIYQKLIHKTKNHHFSIYLKQDMPSRFHYRHSNRISPIQVIPDVGYIFTTHKMSSKEGDDIGYDNLADDMKTIFLAKGPKLNKIYKQGSILAPFVNVEVYGFMTELLNIDAAPNNGTIKTKFPVLYQPPL